MTTLLDTSFLLAVAFERDQNHRVAAQAMRELKAARLVAAPVVVEIFFMVVARISYDRAVHLFILLQTPAFQIVQLTEADHKRMVAIMQQYQDIELDFADVAQVAIAERLDIHRIYTFDRRDFSIIRPQHVTSFDLLP